MTSRAESSHATLSSAQPSQADHSGGTRHSGELWCVMYKKGLKRTDKDTEEKKKGREGGSG